MVRMDRIVRTIVCGASIGVGATLMAAAPPTDLPDRSPGIYLENTGDGDSPVVRLSGARVQDAKMKGMFKMMATSGLARGEMVGSIPGETSDIRVAAGATFDIYIPANTGKDAASQPTDMGDMMRMMSGDAMPPSVRDGSEFAVVKLELQGGHRVVHMGQVGRGSMAPKDPVACSVEKVRPGVFRIQPKSPLAPGEYAFILGGNQMGGQAWDFGVDAK
jgi:hypothetical protein